MNKAVVKIIVVVAMTAALLMNAIVPVSAAEYTQNVLETYLSYYPSPSGWYDVYTIQYDTFPSNGMYQLADGAGFGPCFRVDDWAEDAIYLITCDITYTLSTQGESLSNENVTGRTLALFNTNRPQTTTQSDLTGTNSQGIDYSNLTTINFSPLTSTSGSGTYSCQQVISFSTAPGQIDNIQDKKWATFWTCFDSEGKYTYNNITLSVIYNAEPDVYDLILLKLDNIISSLNNSSSSNKEFYETVETAVTEIITNQNNQLNNESTIINTQQQTNNKIDTVNNNLVTVNNQLELLYQVGNDKNTPNNQEAAKLKETQQDLSDTEQSLENKSKSLTQRASTGLSKSIAASGQFISSVTPAVASVTTQITNAYQALPQDIQPMVLSMPLLSFAVWLIGFKR